MGRWRHATSRISKASEIDTIDPEADRWLLFADLENYLLAMGVDDERWGRLRRRSGRRDLSSKADVVVKEAVRQNFGRCRFQA
jgi:hypothetical protein